MTRILETPVPLLDLPLDLQDLSFALLQVRGGVRERHDRIEERNATLVVVARAVQLPPSLLAGQNRRTPAGGLCTPQVAVAELGLFAAPRRVAELFRPGDRGRRAVHVRQLVNLQPRHPEVGVERLR